MSTTSPESLLLLAAMAIAAGVLGCYVVMRRMVLAADALSHVALPGIGIGLLLHLHPLVGALAALLCGTVLIWAIEGRAGLPTETVIGVVFSGALALGALLTTGDELIHALLGRPGALHPWEVGLALAVAAAVMLFLWFRRRELLVALVSGDVARSIGIRLRRLELEFMLAFAATVALGLRYLGVLLMGALVIIPAATGRHLARDLRGMVRISVTVSVFSSLAGTLLGHALRRPTGPPIILLAAAIFLLSLLKRSRR